MITAYLVGDTQLIARLSAMPEKLRAGVGRAVLRLAQQLQRKVQSEKLTGQVLKVRTGSLRSSINYQVAEDATSVTASVGTNIRYAGIHEFGGTQPGRQILPKRGRALAFEFAGGRRFFASVDRPAAHFPERSFLRSALREMQPTIKAELETAVRGALK
jgi:HK97 gp10 family phage protein